MIIMTATAIIMMLMWLISSMKSNKESFMEKMTFAQKAILKRITEKKETNDGFQDYHEYYSDYNDCHSDYFDSNA